MNALSNLNASRQAEGRRRMTHWAPPALIPRPSLADVAEFAAEAVTPYGNYVSARDAVEDFQGDHPGSGTMNALLALPGLGIVGAVGRGAKRTWKTANALAEADKLARARKVAMDDGILADSLASLHGHQPAFKYPVNHASSSDLNALAREFSTPENQLRAKTEPDGGARITNERTRGYLDVRPSESGDEFYINAEDVGARGGGDAMWQAAHAWIRKKGLQETPDPAGYTKAGELRSVSHGVSSAVREGDTKHLGALRHRHKAGGRAPLETTPQMVKEEKRLIEQRLNAYSGGGVANQINDGNLKFDLDSGLVLYRDSAKRPYKPFSDKDLQEITADTGLVEGNVGGTTLKRYLLYRALEEAPRAVDLKGVVNSPVFYGIGGAAILSGVGAKESSREDIP